MPVNKRLSMLQTWLLILLLLELIGYAWLGSVLHARGIEGWLIAMAVLAIAVCWRASHALVSFLVCRTFRQEDTRQGGGTVAALWGEFCARLISYNLSQPLVQWFMPREPLVSSRTTPILLVHGFFSNRGMWLRFQQRLREHGQSPIFSITLEPVLGDIDEYAAALHARIEEITIATGQPSVIVIAHSMGGLVSRAYMAAHGCTRVKYLITLGSPHAGTRVAMVALGQNMKQMRQDQSGNAWLTSLRARELQSAKPPTTSIYTLNDDLVYPPASSQLLWAENIEMQGVGHVGLLFSKDVFARVLQILRTLS